MIGAQASEGITAAGIRQSMHSIVGEIHVQISSVTRAREREETHQRAEMIEHLRQRRCRPEAECLSSDQHTQRKWPEQRIGIV
jgi:hypothetical protein